MATTATAALINSLIDANAAALKAQIDASSAALKAQVGQLVFNPDPVVIPVVKAPSITYPTQTSFTTGKAISAFSPVNTGDPAIYAATLPTGLSINTSTGVISGTPTVTKAATTYTVTATNQSGSSMASLVLTVNSPVIVVPPDPTLPGGKASGPVTYSNISNQVITGLSIDGGGKSVDLMTLNNCTNVHVTLCRFSNTNGIAVRLYKCTNCTVDYNFFNMVGFGVYGLSSTSLKINNNQGLNRWNPTLYNANFSHWVQFNTCNGAGQQINNNRFEDIDGVAVHPHDHITVYGSNGTAASPIEINNNWIRGGQRFNWPNAGDGGGGIMPGDVSGSYQICKGNILVNPGGAGIQTIGGATNIVIDSNTIYNSGVDKFFNNAFAIMNSAVVVLSNNRVNVTNKWGHNAPIADGEPAYWLGGPKTSPLVTMTNNNWYDPTLNASILPTTIITYK